MAPFLLRSIRNNLWCTLILLNSLMFASLVVPCTVSSRLLGLGSIALVSFFSLPASTVARLIRVYSFLTPDMVLSFCYFMLITWSSRVIIPLTFASLLLNWDMRFPLKTWIFFTTSSASNCIVLLKDSFYAKLDKPRKSLIVHLWLVANLSPLQCLLKVATYPLSLNPTLTPPTIGVLSKHSKTSH